MQPMDICKTVKVKPWGKGQGDYVEINEADFDPKVHALIDDSPAPKPRRKAPAK